MIESGKSPTNSEAMSLNNWNIVDLDVIAIHAVDSEVKRGLKSIQLDLANQYVKIIWTHGYRQHLLNSY